MSNPSFSFYPANVKITKPLGIVTIDQFIEANRNPKDHVKELFKKIQVAGEKEKQDEIIEEMLSSIKMTRLKRQMLRNTLYLGCLPKGNNEKDL